MTDPATPSQSALLRQRRFLPYFLTQLLGAFNDNVYKNALVALIAFGVGAGAGAASGDTGGNDAVLINLAAGLFILPFFLFSAFAGQLADRLEKSALLRRIKLLEIVIMTLGATAFALQNVPMLMIVLFLMGTQSAFFGPVKYSILPQHLDEQELVGGNGLVELGTFLAILGGTIAGTQLISRFDASALPVSVVLLLVAVAGYLASRQVPSAPATAPDLALRFNPVVETWRLISATRRERVIFQAILGISFFWFLGATYLAQFPVYSRDVLGGNADVFTAMLALFSLGIGTGSALCERLSGRRVEIGLVPFGAFGLALFGLDLVLATPAAPWGRDLGLATLVSMPGVMRIAVDLFLIGLFGGFYIVPLYALIQQRSDPSRLARSIACNNIMNALFMVGSAVFAIILLSAGLSVRALFLCLVLLNLVVAWHIFRLVPEFLVRFVIWLLIHTMYRIRPAGLDRLPEQGAAILVANHVSFVDALLLAGCIRRPVRFVMYYRIYRLPGLHWVFRTAGAIPIAGRSEDESLYHQAFIDMQQAIDDGELLCIFPEGQITRDGELNPFRPGVEKLLAVKPVPVYPIALKGLWGSLFSRRGGRAFFKLPRRLFARIEVLCGEPLMPAEASAAALHTRIQAMLDGSASGGKN